MSRSFISLLAMGLCLSLASAWPAHIPSQSLDGHTALLELEQAKAAYNLARLQLVRHQALMKEVQLKSSAQASTIPAAQASTIPAAQSATRPIAPNHQEAATQHKATLKPQVSNQKIPDSQTTATTSHDESSLLDSIFPFGICLVLIKMFRIRNDQLDQDELDHQLDQETTTGRIGRGLFRIVSVLVSVYMLSCFSHLLLFLLSVGMIAAGVFINLAGSLFAGSLFLLVAVPTVLTRRYSKWAAECCTQSPSVVCRIAQPTAGPAPTLSRGDRGAAVVQLQSQLIHLGYMKQNAIQYGAGMFGPFTQEAVARVQQHMGTQPTGQYDSAVRAQLQNMLSKGVHSTQATHNTTPDRERRMCCVQLKQRARRGSATQMTIAPDAQEAMSVHQPIRAAVNPVNELTRATSKQEWNGIWCDACSCTPIVGPRFTKQLQHDTYDLCQRCFNKQSAADQTSFNQAAQVHFNTQNRTPDGQTQPAAALNRVADALGQSRILSLDAQRRRLYRASISQQTEAELVSGNQAIHTHTNGDTSSLDSSGEEATIVFPVEWRPLVRDLQQMGFPQEASQAMVMETNGILREAVKRLMAAERLARTNTHN